MKKHLCILLLFLFFVKNLLAAEYYVSPKGNDNNNGSDKDPFRTIGKAAEYAYPSDTITVRAGLYREWVNPPRGGVSNEQRILYRAASGERVEIKGSEQIKNWVKQGGGVWKVVIPNTFFGNYNPYVDFIYGDWFEGFGRVHHTGEVFLNGKSLYEQEKLEKVLNPIKNEHSRDTEGARYTWYTESDEFNTTIWANFQSYNPNKELVEISTRRTCFYPEKQGINYITIQGFYISQAATQWAAPTSEQVGMVATHWNKGWIIENNVLSNSKCSAITLGKERSTGHNVWSENPQIDGSIHYIEVVFNVLRHGWNKESIGSHIVRNNVIFACEQTAICGSMGAVFSIIENNHIYDIWTKRQFTGAEIAGIKLHAPIDVVIRKNRIHDTGRGLWLDWMTQGARVSSNLFYNNDLEDVFLEVNHGPILLDNNIMCSTISLTEQSQGGAYVHNLIFGKVHNYPDPVRYTPYHAHHSTEIVGLSMVAGDIDRFYNNLFLAVRPQNADKIRGDYGLPSYKTMDNHILISGNVYYNHSKSAEGEQNTLELSDFDPQATIVEEKDGVYLTFNLQKIGEIALERINTQSLGDTRLSRQKFENTDGTPIELNMDYFGQQRSSKPKPGPFENIADGFTRIKVW